MKRNSKNDKIKIGNDKHFSDFKSKSADEVTELAESIIHIVQEPLVILDKDLRVVKANRSFFDYFRVSPGETIGTLIYDLGNRQWDIPKLKELLETILPQKTTFNNYKIEHDFSTIGKRTMLLNARQIERAFGKEKIILLAIEDITEKKRGEDALKESEELFNHFMEKSPYYVFFKDKDIRTIRLSTNYEQMLGKPLNSILGKTMDELFPSELAKKMIEVDKEILHRRETVVVEEEFNGRNFKTIKFPIIINDVPQYLAGFTIDISEQKRAEDALRENEKFLKEIQKIAQLGSYTLDVSNGIWKSSEILDAIFGIEPDYDKSIDGWTSIIHPEWQQLMADYFADEVVAQRKSFDKEYRIVRKADKTDRWVHGLGELVVDNENRPIKMIGTIRDITDLKNAEQEIVNLNRVYALLSNTNEAIVRIKERQKLFDEICRIAIDNGKFRMAWIGTINNDTNKVDVKASAGLIENYLDDINLDLSNEIRSDGPAGKAIRNGTNSITNDIENDKNMLPWKENALRLGYKSCAIFPLIVFGKVIGVLSIYASQKDFFQQQELRLLDEMAMDISFSLEFIETEKKRKVAEENLRISEERFRSLYENSTVGLYRTTSDGKILLANPTLVSLLGYSSFEELASRDLNTDGFEPDYDRKLFIESISIDGEVKGFESAWIRKDGTIVYVLESAKAMRDSNNNILYFDGVVEDITERKRTEEELRESEEKYRAFFENSMDSILLTSPDGRIFSANPAACKMFGYSEQELIRLGRSGIVDITDPQLHILLTERALKGKARGELKLIRKDGTQFPADVSSAIFKDHDGLDSTSMIIRDITEQKQMVDDLLKLSSAVEQSPASIIITDLKGNIEYVNPKVLKSSGYQFSELRGKNPRIFKSGEKSDYDYKVLWDTIRSGEEWRGELHNKKKNGELYWESASISAIKNNLGETIHYLAVKEDITEHKLAEEALRESEEKYRFMFANNPQPMFIYNQETLAFLEINTAAIFHYGYTREEFLSMTLRDIRPKEDKHALMKDVELTRRSYNPAGEWRHLKKNGELINVEIISHSIIFNDRKARHVMVHDITKRKIAESELIASKEKAEEMNRLKTNFLANMSHELRTPLVGILGYADFLRQDAESEEKREMAETIFNSGARLSETLNLILDLSRFESEKKEIKYHKVDLVSKVKEIITLFNKTANKKGLLLKSSFSQDSIIINFDERAFHSILNNLINNAIKFTSEGSVTTTIFLNSDFVEIKVTDTGIGIAEQDYEIIFEEFRQASEGYTRNFEGSGLGLSITKKLVDKFGGTITVESEVGKGSTFKVLLPVTDALENPNESTTSEMHSSTEVLKLKSVKPLALVVDDDPLVFAILKKYTSDYLELDSTVDAEFAFKNLKKKQYDLIFMDINLRRGMDGKEATKKIRTMTGYESIPIIATTAYAMVGDKEEFLAAGCTHYISKPFSKEEIVLLLEEVLKL
ncbi:MAG: PAS domain S-box protein [Ignavibacteriaceae bacterium]